MESCNSDEVGIHPHWFVNEMDHCGIADMCDTGYLYGGMAENVEWAISEGIAPFQPFRVSIGIPHYYQSSYEYPNEWDVDYDWHVDQIIPISNWDASRRWEHYFMEYRRGKEMEATRNKWITQLLSHDTDAMYLNWFSWGGPYSGYSAEQGVRVTLISGRHIKGRYESREWASGESRTCDRKEAMKNMLKAAKKRLPHIHGNKIRNLSNYPAHHRFHQVS